MNVRRPCKPVELGGGCCLSQRQFGNSSRNLELHRVGLEVELYLARALAGVAAGMYIPVDTPAPA